MKTNNKLPIADCRLPVERQKDRRRAFLIANRKSEMINAFTLIEILVVILIIAALAALILPLAGAVRRSAFIKSTQTQMSQIETALESYHSAYGFYPPGSSRSLTNQLYYELVGMTNTTADFQTLDGSARIKSGTAFRLFGVYGFMNCSKPGGDESASHARDFLPDLKPDQVYSYTAYGDSVKALVVSCGGPDPDYTLWSFRREPLALRLSRHEQSRFLRSVGPTQDGREDQPDLQLDQTGADQHALSVMSLCAPSQKPDRHCTTRGRRAEGARNGRSRLNGAIACWRRGLPCD